MFLPPKSTKFKEKKTEKLQKNEDKNKTNGGNRPSVK